MMLDCHKQDALDSWYEKGLGKHFLTYELALLQKIFQTLYGYYCIQPTLPHHFVTCDIGNFVRRITVQEPDPMIASQKPVVWGEPQALPILSNTMDLALLPHVLEFSSDPLNVLQEYYRVLKPDGYLVILGFNPLSLLGLQHVIFRTSPFVRGKLMRSTKILHALRGLSCKIEFIEAYGLSLGGLDSQSSWFVKQCEVYLKKIFPIGCSAYLIVAQKKVIPLTLIKPRWQKQTPLPSKFLKPSAQCEKGEDFL